MVTTNSLYSLHIHNQLLRKITVKLQASDTDDSEFEMITIQPNTIYEKKNTQVAQIFLDTECVWQSDDIRDSTIVVVKTDTSARVKICRRVYTKNYNVRVLELRSHGAREKLIWD